MMFDWWKKKKEERKKKEQEENDAYWKAHEDLKKLKKEECSSLDLKFTQKSCPINNGKYCSRECIHFQPAHIVDFSGVWDSNDIYIKVRRPSCRLWRKEE